jgi:hypothetical protein
MSRETGILMSRETGIGEAVAKAMVALEEAERQFTRYAEHHRAKGADDKAATNCGYARRCGVALEHLKIYFGMPEQAP